MNKAIKITALLFLMLANAGIVAHTVFCHHFDGIQPVAQCDHRSCHGHIENCALATIYVKTDKCNETFILHNCDFELLPCFSTLFLNDASHPIADGSGLPFRQKPYLISYHTEYISQSLGLRASPAC